MDIITPEPNQIYVHREEGYQVTVLSASRHGDTIFKRVVPLARRRMQCRMQTHYFLGDFMLTDEKAAVAPMELTLGQKAAARDAHYALVDLGLPNDGLTNSKAREILLGLFRHQ
jgi:hypothetical protein